jgi:hypothetical protein
MHYSWGHLHPPGLAQQYTWIDTPCIRCTCTLEQLNQSSFSSHTWAVSPRLDPAVKHVYIMLAIVAFRWLCHGAPFAELIWYPVSRIHAVLLLFLELFFWSNRQENFSYYCTSKKEGSGLPYPLPTNLFYTHFSPTKNSLNMYILFQGSWRKLKTSSAENIRTYSTDKNDT